MNKSRDKDPLGGSESYQALQALLHPKNMSCCCAGAQLQRAGERACLPVLIQAGRELGGVSHFLSDLAGMMVYEPAFHVAVKSLVQFNV